MPFWICFCEPSIYWTPADVDGNSTYGGLGESNLLLFTCFPLSFKYAGMQALYWCFINFMTISRASSRLLRSKSKTLSSHPPSLRGKGRMTLFSVLGQINLTVSWEIISWVVSGRGKRQRTSLGHLGGKGQWKVSGSMPYSVPLFLLLFTFSLSCHSTTFSNP